MRIAIIASLILLGSYTVAAQDSAIPQSPPAKIEGKFAIVRFEQQDRTTVALAHQKVGGETACGIWVSAGYTYIGKQAKPERVYISFVRDSSDQPMLLKSEAERMLILAVDGETLTLGAMPSVKQVVTGYSLTTQGLMLPIPYDTFSRIANAKKVDVRLGPLRFGLTNQNLQDFRDLQHRISQAQ